MEPEPTFQSEFHELGHDIKSFIETRYEILRAELSAGVARLRGAAILLGIAALFGATAMILLATCASLAIAFGLGAIQTQAGLIGGFLVVGCCCGVIAAIGGGIGISRLKTGELTPKHTIHVLKRDGESFRQGGERYGSQSSTRRSA
jgi:uncharacterized membrane protein YqjE